MPCPSRHVAQLERNRWIEFFLALVPFVFLPCAARAVEGVDARHALADRKVESRAEIHQLHSSAERPYTVFQYEVPTPNAVPHILAIDEDDHVWFSESGGRFARNFIDVPPQGRIGRLDKNGTISEWKLPREEASPMGVLFDSHGDLWITERLGNRITRLGRDGSRKEYEIPTPGSWPTGIALDSRGRIWFTETKGDKIGVIDPATGTLREYPLPARGTMSTGIAVDLQDRVWVAERDIHTIGLFDPATEKFTQFALPTPDAKPCGLAVAPDGTVWFSERGAGKIGKIDAGGSIQEIATPDRFAGPFFLVADRRGSIWFSELFSGKVARFDPQKGDFEHFSLPGKDPHPAGLAIDSKGNVWYAAQSTNKVGVIVRTDLSYIAGETAGGPPTSVPEPAPHTFMELDVPTPQSIPGIVGVDRHDTVWFTQMGGGWVGPGFPPGPAGGKIGYIRNGVLSELPTPTLGSGPTSLALDPCSDDLWVTLRNANKIARVRDFQITEYNVPLADSLPVGIAVDYDHNVWVALSQANKLGRRTPAGEWTFLDLPQPEAEPRTIYVDPWNEVWFAEKTGNHVGRVDKEKWRVERWEIPTRVAWPLSLISDDDGNLWFAEMRSDKLAMLDRKTNKIIEFSLPVQSAPFKLLYDAGSSAMWISTVFYNAILRFDLESKRLTGVYKIPSEGAWVGGLDRDSQGCIWFSEQFANKIGRLCIEGISEVQASEILRPIDPMTVPSGRP
jgi:streptogramin lyase